MTIDEAIEGHKYKLISEQYCNTCGKKIKVV